MTRTALYDLFLDGERVYVGITQNPARRFKAHVGKKFVPDTAELRVVCWFDCRQQALDAERDRITAYRPKLNIYYVFRPNGEEWEAARKRRQMQKDMPSPAYIAAWAKVAEAANEVMEEDLNSYLQERTRAGVKSAMARGVKFGVEPLLTPAQIKRAQAMRDKGMSARAIAEELGCSHSTVYNWTSGPKRRRKN